MRAGPAQLRCAASGRQRARRRVRRSRFDTPAAGVRSSSVAQAPRLQSTSDALLHIPDPDPRISHGKVTLTRFILIGYNTGSVHSYVEDFSSKVVKLIACPGPRNSQTLEAEIFMSWNGRFHCSDTGYASVKANHHAAFRAMKRLCWVAFDFALPSTDHRVSNRGLSLRTGIAAACRGCG